MAPAAAGEQSRCHPRASSSSISAQAQHPKRPQQAAGDTPHRNPSAAAGHSSPGRWDSPGQPAHAAPARPCTAELPPAALSEMQKDRPALELRIAKLFGRKRKV